MKSICLIYILLYVTLPALSFCRDFKVTFVEENYKESSVPYSNKSEIYHTIQVRSDAGPKLLILTGEHPDYRKWLRQSIARDKNFMVQVPDESNDAFISAKVFKIDVTQVHPFNGSKWSGPTQALKGEKDKNPAGGVRSLIGDRNIMVIDKNLKRTGLIASIVERMGFTAFVSRDAGQALRMFQVQPEKFKMIITSHETGGMPADKFIDGLLKIDHQIPIVVETGYNNDRVRDRFLTKFSGAGSVTVTPVVLSNLQATIKQLIKSEKVNG